MIKPYYQDQLITLYHGDSREILPQLDPVDVIYTDPVWPGCEKIWPGIDAYKLFADCAIHFPRLAKRVIIHLGCCSDVRILSAIPDSLKFFRVCWMRIIPCKHAGSALIGADVLYVFGERYVSKKGNHCIPGESPPRISRGITHKKSNHPAYRGQTHMQWIIDNYTRQNDVILDPFSGSGTCLIAAARAGRKSIGIEIEEKWCKETVRRIKSEIGLIASGDLKFPSPQLLFKKKEGEYLEEK